MRNKESVSQYITDYSAINLGWFECDIDKNFFSPSNWNFAFNQVQIFKYKDEFLFQPVMKSWFGSFYRRPFILSKNKLKVPGIEHLSVQEISYEESQTSFKLQAPLNTKLKLTVFNTNGVFNN